MKRAVVLCCVAMFSCPGCFSAAKRAITEVRGASGKVVPVQDCSTTFYASIGRIKLGSATNTIQPVCPPGVFALVKGSVAEAATAASQRLDGGETAQLDLDMCFYNPPGGVMAVAGKAGLLLARVSVKDGTGRQQGDLLVGVSSEAIRTGDEDMAEELGKVLVGHIQEQAQRAARRR